MEQVEQVRWFSKLIGGKRSNVGPRLFILLNLAIQANQLFAMYINWNIFVKRLLAFKEFNSSLFSIFMCSAIDDITLLCDMTEKQLTKDQQQCRLYSRQKLDITSKCKSKMESIDSNLQRVLLTLMGFASVLPIIFALLIILLKGPNNVTIDKLPFIIHTYYPEDYKTFKVYFASLFLQFTWYGTMLSYVYCASLGFALASISLCTEMKLICESLFAIQSCGFQNDITARRGNDFEDIKNLANLKQSVREHQDLLNDTVELNRRSRILLSGFINILAIQICCYIFFMIELDSLSARIKYFVTMQLVFILILFFSYFGQTLTDESANLQMALYECSWTDQSLEFKKCLLMMMNRASRQVIIRPYNLYVVDFRCITNIVNATYSYFNLISNSK